MLMEAMRLSLLDHEEHQRKEAEEKKKKATAGATGDNGPGRPSNEAESTTSPPGPGPSTLEASSTLHASSSTNISSPVSSISRSGSPSPPKQATLSSQESLEPGRRSWSISRSRTPPPNPVPNVPLSEDNQAAWRSRTGAPPFSTLSAALTSTSTAAAFLGSSSSGEQRTSRSVTPEPTPAPSSTLLSLSPPSQGSLTTAANDGEPSLPPITVEIPEPAAPVVDLSHVPVEDIYSTHISSIPIAEQLPPVVNVEAPQSSSPISSITTVESEAGAGTGVSSYGFLPSSPESDMSHEPLLGSSHLAASIDDASKNGQAATVSTRVEEVSR